MIKNVTPLQYGAPLQVDVDRLSGELQKFPFVPCSGSEKDRSGWTAFPDDAYARKVDRYFLMTHIIEKKSVPPAVLKEAIKEDVERYKNMAGQEPKGKLLRQLKDEALARLLPRAFPKRTLVPVWFSNNGQLVLVGSTSASAVKVVLNALNRVGLWGDVRMMNTEESPSKMMTDWLLGDAAHGFTVDDACELVQRLDGKKPTVKFASHNLDGSHVTDHIKDGKVPASLALTFNSKLSFVLTDQWMLKSMRVIDAGHDDVLVNEDDPQASEDANFLISAEVANDAILSLAEAMGGIPEAA